LALVAGRVPVIIELKGNPGHDDGLVRAVAADLSGYNGPAAVMSFAHWHVRKFADQAPGVARGLTAEGVAPGQLEAHFSMLAHDIQFVSFSINELPNLFVQTVRDKLAMPVITWTVRTPEQVALTLAHGDQMTFEGFLPPCSAENSA
jgi:glycerophosphoryl diester phosphodiesterase